MSENKIPYKIYLEESEMPKDWYNVRADMKNKPAPLLNPGTHEPMTSRLRQRSITNSKAITPAEATSSIPPLHRHFTQRSRDLRA